MSGKLKDNFDMNTPIDEFEKKPSAVEQQALNSNTDLLLKRSKQLQKYWDEILKDWLNRILNKIKI